uniref:Uncharacterized protein n=1 Tax=Peronospora matthiolae TaxID=2874970 RepID=A0AAV1UWK0_9STRA
MQKGHRTQPLEAAVTRQMKVTVTQPLEAGVPEARTKHEDLAQAEDQVCTFESGEL